MKLTAILSLLTVVAATAVSARETNGQRLARGLPPLPPVRRGTGVDTAKRHQPSYTPPHGGGGNQCSSDTEMQCCNTVTKTSNPVVPIVAEIVGCELPAPHVPIGLGCSPLALGGVGGSGCQEQTVCCQDNKYNGVIAIGCSPLIL